MVRFKRSPGKTYIYPEAPGSVLEQMLESESIGSFFQNQVRGNYAHRVVDAEED